LLYKAANTDRGVKITSRKVNGYVLKIAAQKIHTANGKMGNTLTQLQTLR